jgi:uncharacterized OB-fold protein
MLMSKDRKVPAPVPGLESQAFFDAAKEGRFLIKKCRACGKAHWYPRAICPFCASEDTEWVESAGKATIYSYSVMRRVPEPFALAYVTLAEGPTVLTNLVDCDFDALKIGQAVTFTFKPAENGTPVLMFKPA